MMANPNPGTPAKPARSMQGLADALRATSTCKLLEIGDSMGCPVPAKLFFAYVDRFGIMQHLLDAACKHKKLDELWNLLTNTD